MKRMTICIDAGHGGKDPGAVGRVKEKDVNLTVAMALRELLWKAGHQVVMTRHSDNFLGLHERAELANLSRTDLFISIHHNAGGGDGYEVIHSVYHGVGRELAECIGAEFAKNQNPHGATPIYDKQGTHGGDFFTVISATNMPAIICEYAFVDTRDAAAIDTPEELKAEAGMIAAGLRAWLVKVQAAEAEQALRDRNPHLPTTTQTVAEKMAVNAPVTEETPVTAGETAVQPDAQPDPAAAEAMASFPDDDQPAAAAPAPARDSAPKGKGRQGRGRAA